MLCFYLVNKSLIKLVSKKQLAEREIAQSKLVANQQNLLKQSIHQIKTSQNISVNKTLSIAGKVDEAVMLMDQQTKRHRGFGFVTFENEETVDRVCEIHFHTIKNKKVNIKVYNGRIKKFYLCYIARLSVKKPSQKKLSKQQTQQHCLVRG